MERYTRNEHIDMLLIYGECRKNAVQAQELYQQRYPNRRHPNRRYFSRLEQRLRREGNQNNRENFIVNEETEINALALVEITPGMSTREVGSECGISHMTAQRILRKHKYRSRKYQLHQHLYEADHQRRLAYCHWFLGNHYNDINFAKSILYTDESRFTNFGVFNRNNTRYWSKENKHLVRQVNRQERFGFNCWVGIIGERIVGPIFFRYQLTGERYLDLLQNDIEEGLDNLPLETLRTLYFQQDGAPPHNSRAVTQFLNNKYGQRLISTNGPVQWPPRSPDLTPLDFFLWGTLKNKVYATPSNTVEELQRRVVQACEEIAPQVLQNVVLSTVRRVELCQRENGNLIEQLL